MDRIAEIMKKKKESGISWDTIEQDIGIPSSTIRNHLSGRVINPSNDLLDAVEASIDAWREPQCPPQDAEMQTNAQHVIEMMGKTRSEMLDMSAKLYEQQIAQLERALAKAERRIKHLTVALAALLVFFFLVLIFDLLDRSVGWFREALGFVGGIPSKDVARLTVTFGGLL